MYILYTIIRYNTAPVTRMEIIKHNSGDLEDLSACGVFLTIFFTFIRTDTPWSIKKTYRRTFIHTNGKYWSIFRIFSPLHSTLRTICDRTIDKDFAPPKTRRYTILWSKNFQNLHQPKQVNGKRSARHKLKQMWSWQVGWYWASKTRDKFIIQ